ncbi:aromatic amino acid lyase [Hymenobacter sp. NBH84]|uniref:aromatic amino acid lyase n=1 Tax=Hymenobacter sp. NBH84 TaxID=2596915 RepID=UPI001629914F|nr:aromatic amino acid lyase [Hymenobacter sp. NBH84]QNE38945.1 aromatic amino acid lyase [Hymenobacter sp. NBH84]
MAEDFLLTPTTPLTLPTLRTLLASDARVVTDAGGVPTSSPDTTASAAPLLAAACGVGAEAPGELVRLMLLLQAGQQQRRGASAATVRRLLDFYNREVLPVVYQQGGDQAGLAHLSLPLFGLGEVNYQGYRLQTSDVLELFGWAPLPQADADVATLLTGTSFTLAYAVRAWLRAEHLLLVADSLISLSLAVLRGDEELVASPTHTACHAALAYVQQALEAAFTAPTPDEQHTPRSPLSTPDAADVSLALRTLLLTVAELGSRSAGRTEQLLRSAAPMLAGLRHPVGSLLRQNNQLCAVLPAADGRYGNPSAEVAISAYQLLDNTEQLLGIELVMTSQQLPAQLPVAAHLVLDAREKIPPLVEQQPVYPVVHAAAQFVRRYAQPGQAV